MTDVRIRMRRPGTAAPVRAEGVMLWSPTRAATAPEGLLLPAPLRVTLAAGSDATLAGVTPCDGTQGWCWVAQTWVDSTIVDTRAVLVPNTPTTLDLEDLVVVDPASLTPATNIPAWEAAVTAIQQAVATVPSLVAGNPDLLAAAVALAQSDAGLARTRELGMTVERVQESLAGELVLAVGDARGRVAAGVDERGRLRTLGGVHLRDGSLSPDALGSGVGALDPSTGYLWGAVDPAGRLRGVVRVDGTLDGGASSPSRIACIGDSMVRGYTGGTAWALADAWPAHLDTLAGDGVTVTNLGFGGNTIDEVRVRLGLLPVPVEVTGGVIPASGAVAVTTATKLGLAATGTYYGTIAGVVGNVTLTGAMGTFTRAVAGDATPAPRARFVGLRDDYSSDTWLIWIGRNDNNYGTLGPEGDVTEHVVAAITDLVASMRVQHRRYLIMPIMPRYGDEPPGSAGFERIAEQNRRLALAHPGRVLWDVADWYIHGLITDLGITPTPLDVAAMSAGCPPPSITDADVAAGSHYISAAAPLIAARLHTALTSRGWL